MDLKAKIREIADWPIKGVNFKDITTLLQDGEVFKYVIDNMIKPFQNKKIDKLVVIDARGFLLGTPIAYNLGVGVSLVRKKNKLPYKTIEESYKKEYGYDTIAMHEDAVKKGEKILIVDDLLATGGTMGAVARMIERLGGDIVGISLIIDLPFLGGSEKLKRYSINYLVSYDNE